MIFLHGIPLYCFQFFALFFRVETIGVRKVASLFYLTENVMLQFAEIFVIFLMMVILMMYLAKHYGEVEYVRSTFDQKEYLVRNLEDKQQAADLLAMVTDGMSKLVKHMMAKYPENPDVQRLYENFNPDSVSEGSNETGYTSYSVNKGEKIIICIRQKDKNNTFVSKNTIMYVAIHELGHLMTEDIGHTTPFWDNFKFLLKEAMAPPLNLYVKVDYAQDPHEYCGIQITNSVA